MALNIGIIFLLMFPSLVIAEVTVNEKDRLVNEKVFIIIGISFASVFVAMGLIVFVYLTLRCIKRKMFEPQYYIDDIPSHKDNSEFNGGNNDIHPQVSNIYQIQPILTVSHIISSIRQSFVDLGNSLIPFGWSRAQHVYNQQHPVNEKIDLPI